ncbi:SH3 domain-containing protein [Friedmanniella luteola]|uniref:SH3 domain-containing protein n=1 Tax=Friedmanniella luteola TaxID=546871 RepID=A0A1H1ZXG1_9ACTN|nr:SH3 domain-containing protein [Friedmanniella luteola]SDT38353.1 SH3 domain-containing protein [Friedmanniella luteola]
MARLAVPGLLAGLATTGLVAVSTGATTTAQSGSSTGASAVPSTTASAPADAVTREQGTSRGGSGRPALTPAAAAQQKAAAKAKAAKAAKAKAAKAAKAEAKKAEAKKATAKAGALPEVDLPSLEVVDTEYTRVDLNVREGADADSDLITVLKSGSKVPVTSTVRGAWQYVAYRGDGGWVRRQYLVESKPQPPAAQKPSSSGSSSSGSGGGLSGAACSAGSSVESGLTPDAIRVHRAICAQFPGVTAYGGVRADSLPEHPSGRALDAMVSSNGLGQQIANWVRANAKQLGVSEVIFAQKIWTVQRGSEGWRGMSDRGSATANHYDHVHVTVYGNAAG